MHYRHAIYIVLTMPPSVQIQSIRKVRQQLLRLLSRSEAQEVGIAGETAFSAFSEVNPLHYSPFSAREWRQAVAQFDASISPAEHRIAAKLRAKFRATETAQQVTYPSTSRYSS